MEIYGIATKEFKRATPLLWGEIFITPEGGLRGDYRGRVCKPDRKVTLLSLSQWKIANKELMESNKEFEVELPWHARRANICLTGVSFCPQHLGQILYLYGGTEPVPLLRVTDELEPCKRMDELATGLQKALEPDWRGGVTCEVLCECVIRTGDVLYFSDLPAIPDA